MLSILFTILGIILALIVGCIAIKVFIVLLPFLLIIGGVVLFVKCDSLDFSFLENISDEYLNEKNKRERSNQKIVYRVRDEDQRIIHRNAQALTVVKDGSVNMSSLRPEIDSAIIIIVDAFQDAVEDNSFRPIITSANDFSGHASNSAHYVGAAVDLRIKDIGNLNTRENLVKVVKMRLDDRFTILHEDIGSENEHLHVQLRRGVYNANERWR